MAEKIYIALVLVALLSVTEAAIPRDQCQLFCTNIGFPVCGSDGTTYGNPCELRAGNCLKSPYQQVTLVRNGTCDPTTTYEQTVPYLKPTECTLACTDGYTPVCGSDGITYSNACEVRVRNCQGSPYDQITIIRNGTCKTTTTPTTTTTTKTPTYRTTSPGNPYESCPLGCTLELNQVCGSDGSTYSNPCQLRSENCLRSPYEQVVLVKNGTCDKTTTTYRQTAPYPKSTECTLVCTDDYPPVCGSDGNTYGNACQVRVRNCRGSPYDQITIVNNGTCEAPITTTTTYPTPEPVNPYEPCPLACTRELNQVCGSDGTTYSNPCQLRVGNCERSPYDQVVLVRNGSCDTTYISTTPATYRQTVPYLTLRECSLFCTDDYTPVCGSDGITYSNACRVRVRNCQGSPYDQITIVSKGACETTTTSTTTTTKTTKTTAGYPRVYP